MERVALRLCKAWQDDGADVTVLLGRSDGATQYDAPDLTYVQYPSGPISTARFETAWMILCLRRQILAARPDVIFCAGNSYTIVAVALRLLLGRRCPPIVAKVSNSLDRKDLIPPIRFVYRQWLRLQGPLIARWVSMADAMRAEIAHAMRVPLAEVEVIDDPALCERESKNLAAARDSFQRTPERGRLFIAAGRLVPQKRFDLLIRAFARGGHGQDRLVILGEGPLRRKLEALIARHELDERVSLPGHAPRLETWLVQADAFILSSDYEGVPAVVIEALAAGVPVIATDSSAALPELLGHGRFGRLVGRRDEARLAEAIADSRALLTDKDGARRHADRFVIERRAADYLRVLRAQALEHRHALSDQMHPS